MTAIATPPERLRGTVAPGVPSLMDRLREAMGRAHYERMRLGMAPDLLLDAWEDLRPGSREAYRVKTDFLLPAVVAVVNGELTEESAL